jgi:hypothetical protein
MTTILAHTTPAASDPAPLSRDELALALRDALHRLGRAEAELARLRTSLQLEARRGF